MADTEKAPQRVLVQTSLMTKDGAAPPDDDRPIHLVTVDWSRGKWSGTAGSIRAKHVCHFGGKLALKVTDALAPAAYRDSARLDPLKSFVATVASARALPVAMLDA